MSMVDTLIAGDTLDFTDVVAAYPATDGWTLKYRLVPRFAAPVQAPIELTATPSGADYRVQETSVGTSSWTAGAYNWFRWVEKTGERQSLGSGSLTVQLDPATAAQGTDTRSHIEKVLAAIEALIEGRTDVQEYSIGNRSIKKMPVPELLKWRNLYRQELRSAQAADRIAAGLPGRKVQVVLR
jgi:hypothetical protein